MDKHSEQDALFGSYEEVFGVDDEHDTLPSDDEEQEDYLVGRQSCERVRKRSKL